MPRSRSACEQLAGADHRLDPVLELGDDQRVQLLDQLRRAARLAQPPLQHAAGDLGRGADQLALVGGGELDAAAREEVLLGPGPDRLGVEQQAVVVEDDGVGQGGAIAGSSQLAAAQPDASVAACAFHVEISRRLPPRPGLQPQPRGPDREGRRALAGGPPIEMGDREWEPRESSLKILEGPEMETARPLLRPGLVERRARARRTSPAELLAAAPPPSMPDAFVVETETPGGARPPRWSPATTAGRSTGARRGRGSTAATRRSRP